MKCCARYWWALSRHCKTKKIPNSLKDSKVYGKIFSNSKSRRGEDGII
jgi:hypothetical protein